MKSQVFSAKKLLSRATVRGESARRQTERHVESASSTLNVGKESLRVRQFTARGHGAQRHRRAKPADSTALHVRRQYQCGPVFTAQAVGAARGDGTTYIRPQVLQSASLSTFFSGTSAYNPWRRRSQDQTTLRGSASIANLRQPNYKSGRADRLNISRYLAPEDRRKAATPGAPQPRQRYRWRLCAASMRMVRSQQRLASRRASRQQSKRLDRRQEWLASCYACPCQPVRRHVCREHSPESAVTAQMSLTRN